MELVVNLWEDLQFTYHFEGLLVFCAGKKNTLADIASRVKQDKVEKALTTEIQRQMLGNLEVVRNEVTWIAQGIDIDIESALIANWRMRNPHLQKMTVKKM